MKKNNSSTTRLINTKSLDLKTLPDYIYCIAGNVEQSLIEAGAVPGKDYELLDLFYLAVPIANKMKMEEIDFMTEI
jgi:hypothetical protein